MAAKTAIVVLAAGEGTRMVSAVPKVLHQVGGRPLIAHVLEAAKGAGADKIAINSAAVKDPALIGKIAARFGSQAVVVAIDARRANGGFEVFVAGGRVPTGRDALQWAREAADCGAGEILLTSMDRDGTQAGFDCELVQIIADAVSIPVIASGGAGSPQHFIDVFRNGRADAALAASIFHFGIENIGQLKRELHAANVPVRWPC